MGNSNHNALGIRSGAVGLQVKVMSSFGAVLNGRYQDARQGDG